MRRTAKAAKKSRAERVQRDKKRAEKKARRRQERQKRALDHNRNNQLAAAERDRELAKVEKASAPKTHERALSTQTDGPKAARVKRSRGRSTQELRQLGTVFGMVLLVALFFWFLSRPHH